MKGGDANECRKGNEHEGEEKKWKGWRLGKGRGAERSHSKEGNVKAEAERLGRSAERERNMKEESGREEKRAKRNNRKAKTVMEQGKGKGKEGEGSGE